jgi:hypothetical protein
MASFSRRFGDNVATYLIWIGAELVKPSFVDRWLAMGGLIMEAAEGEN